MCRQQTPQPLQSSIVGTEGLDFDVKKVIRPSLEKMKTKTSQQVSRRIDPRGTWLVGPGVSGDQ